MPVMPPIPVDIEPDTELTWDEMIEFARLVQRNWAFEQEVTAQEEQTETAAEQLLLCHIKAQYTRFLRSAPAPNEL